ncbi:MAG TPA: hypothetical protein VHI77_10550 [Solirubrobacterales bacterium]|jgi:hypothetical protein|nr:hypothetical protein [Solirubrobacterales bacterium]
MGEASGQRRLLPEQETLSHEERLSQEAEAVEIPPESSWGWTIELSPAHLEVLGPVGLELWRRGREWVNRRVETIELLDVDTVRVRLSVDFRIPKKLPASVEFAETQPTFCLPLTILQRKTSLAYFDVRDEEGNSLPLLTRQENAQLTSSILTTAARGALAGHRNPDGSEMDLSQGLRVYLASIPKRSRRQAEQFVDWVLDPHESTAYPDPAVAEVLLRDQEFRDLLGLAASCSFIHVPIVAQPGERRIVKITLISPWDSPSPGAPPVDGESWLRHRVNRTLTWLGWRAESRYLGLPHVGNAETFHVQVSAPERVEFTEAGMRNKPPGDVVEVKSEATPKLPEQPPEDPNDAAGYQQFLGGVRKRKHLYIERAHLHRAGIVWVRFRVVRHGFLRAAVSVGWLTTIILALYAARADHVLGEAQTAAALLLLLPALIAGFLIAPGEHAMTRHLLRGPRFLTAAIGLLALIATAMMVTLPAGGPNPTVPVELPRIWWTEAAMAAAISALLTVSLFVPRPGKRGSSSPPTQPERPFIGPRREHEEEPDGYR